MACCGSVISNNHALSHCTKLLLRLCDHDYGTDKCKYSIPFIYLFKLG